MNKTEVQNYGINFVEKKFSTYPKNLVNLRGLIILPISKVPSKTSFIS